MEQRENPSSEGNSISTSKLVDSAQLPPSNVNKLMEGGISTMSFRIDKSVTSSVDSSLSPLSGNTVSLEPVVPSTGQAEKIPTPKQININTVSAGKAVQSNAPQEASNSEMEVEPFTKDVSDPKPMTEVPQINQVQPSYCSGPLTQPCQVDQPSIGLIQAPVSTTLTTTTAVKDTPTCTSTSNTPAGSLQLPLDLSALVQSDSPLLSLLQSNLPHLNQIKENLKVLLQNSLIIQSLKSSVSQAVTTPTQSSSTKSSIQTPKTVPNVPPPNPPLVTPTQGMPGSPHRVVPTSSTPITPVSMTKTTPLKVPTTVSSHSLPVTNPGPTGSSRKPVLAQIIPGSSQQKAGGIQQVMVGNKLLSSLKPTQKPLPKPVNMATQVTPLSSADHAKAITCSSSPKPHSNLRLPLILQKDHGMNLSAKRTLSMRPSDLALVCEGQSTLVKPVDQEPMDIDVGELPPSLELPPFLQDHTYCIYNLEVTPLPQPLPEYVPNIPSERLSYAPEVPDSPRTLYKLLKVLPKKANGSLPRPKSGKIYNTPSSRPLRRPPPLSSRKRKTPVMKRTHLDSGDEDGTPDGSDNEYQPTTRRRSQRNAGQRKRYVDDIELSISDEETYDEIMQPPPQKTGYYSVLQEEEESDYDENSVSSGMSYTKDKKQKKLISVNPTEGFRYSDIYLDAPPEEANIVEKILSHRERPPRDEHERAKYGDRDVEEFLVKYKNYSYLHAEWATMEKLLKGDRRFEGKVKRYKAKYRAQGIFANIDNEPFNPEYTVVDRVLDVARQTEPTGESVVHYLVKWKSLPYEDSTWELEEDIDASAIKFFCKLMAPPSDEDIEYIRRPAPNRFKPIKEGAEYKGDNHIRPYQLEGLNWLLFNYYIRQNCILADEMGLGKTVQSIVFLLEVINIGIRGPFLVVCPLSTIANWQREFETWSDMNVVIYHGSAYSRRMIHEYELYYRDSDGRVITDAYKFNVLVTTYDVLLSDNSELLNILWRIAIFDEAHRLKNKNCKMLEGLKEMHMEHRVLLTGTPLQNNVEELFSLLNFLEPSKFSSLPSFLLQFGELKTEEQVEELKDVLKPMMLRRLKVDVEKTLAPKEETIVEVELTAIQKQYYRAILEKNFTFLNKGTNVPSLLNTMMELRKCCNHPYLINGAEMKIVADFQQRYPERDISEALIQASGKLVLVDKLLPKLKENGHKVLIFSQMVRCLDILEDYLRMKGFFYERIDGQVRGTLRQAAIDRFSKPDSDRFVFLLCTRAGGLGINLTAADTVIIYDSDWNPQNDIQAQARCHRIGQNKMVKVYRLITHNSYEREMFDKASLKLGLDKAVLQTMNSQQQSSGNPQLNKNEIENLLKKGAYGLIMDSDDAANQFCEEDIDQILERRTQVIQLSSEDKGSTFSKASFVSGDAGDITLDDPDFWQKWAEKANLDLNKLARKDTLVVDEPRVRRQVRRYGDELLETVVDMDDSQEDIMDIIPARGKKGWTKLECFKTEKGLLIYGWGEWSRILSTGRFKKRQLSPADIENIARTMLVYCLRHFSGDEKVKLYIHRLIDPSEVTEEEEEPSDPRASSTGRKKGLFSRFTEDDYLALMAKDPESLFQEESYMKHLRRHSTRILLRVRQLHVIRWAIMNPFMAKINEGVPASELGLTPPKPEEDPPVPWWDTRCDLSLLVAIVKHGYEQFRLWRSDPTLCFKELVGEEALKARKSKKVKSGSKTPSKGPDVSFEGDSEGEEEEDYENEFYEGEDSEGEMGSSTSSTPRPSSLPPRKTRSSMNTLATPTGATTPQQVYVWPSLAEINTRARRIVNAYFKFRKREESRLAQLQKVKEKKERVAEESRKKEQKKAELAQKWSKREEQDFARVVSFFGVEYDESTGVYDWKKFRQLANLGKKTDERLTMYFYDFKKMCERVIRKRPAKMGLSGTRIEVCNEDRAIKCLQRIELLKVVRRELLHHPEFEELVRLCEASFEVPHWWMPGKHDKDLLIGIAKHGMYRTDHLIYNDPELSFLESIPKSALFTPNPSLEETTPSNNPSDIGTNVGNSAGTMVTTPPHDGGEQDIESDKEEGEVEGDGEEEEEEGTEGSGAKPKMKSTPVPLGWPKEKALVIRVSRITYAFRNRVWPKPMEGLELFNPVAKLMTEPNSPSPSPSPSLSPSSSSPPYITEYWGEEEEEEAEGEGEEEQSVVCGESDGSDGDYEMEVDRDDDDDYRGPPPPKKSDLTLRIGKGRIGRELTFAMRNRSNGEGGASSSTSSNSGSVPPPSLSSFQVEKQQGLKMTFRKSSKSNNREQEPANIKLIVKIPLVMLQFPSSKGLKRIPRKRPHDKDGDYVD